MPARCANSELAGGRDVGAEPFVGEEPQDRERREGLRPVDDERVGCALAVGAGLLAQRQLVVDDERRPELARELAGPQAAQQRARRP